MPAPDPAPAAPPTDEPLSLPVADDPAPRPPLPVVSALLPMLAAVVLWAVTGSVLSLWFAALGPLLAGGAALDGLRSSRRDRRHARRRHARARAETVAALADRHAAERRRLAARHPDVVTALHLTDVSQYHVNLAPPQDMDDAEREYLQRARRWQAAEGGYAHEQSTRPYTLAAGLGDSPAGLAAWIGEKLVRWTDSDGTLTNAFSLDEALTWISAYWFTGSIGTSFAPYAAGRPTGWPRIETPTVFTLFPKDLVNAPQQFAERYFKVAGWMEFESGGHFAAWERPQEYLEGVRAAVKLGFG